MGAVIEFWGDILYTQRCCWGCKLHNRHILQEDIVVPYVTTYAIPLRMSSHAYTIITIRKRRQSVASGTQLTSTTHFSCRRNIVGRLCISPTIVFLILSNQKARVRALTSRRISLSIEQKSSISL